jgi:hypothetical protein
MALQVTIEIPKRHGVVSFFLTSTLRTVFYLPALIFE